MPSPAIRIQDLWKEYRLAHASTRPDTFYELLGSTLRAPLQRLRRLQGDASDQEPFWALKDINLEIQPGEVVGVIGRNGAGKSTLLKILSRITAPTRGRIEVRGRLASLLEVGTGFHPELSGRENIYLNGAILGMTRREVARKFDEIVDFAEIETFIDTPVKRYSSGMYVRLAFAVAAHLDVDVLLVDEVLAVGDMQFQKKCLGKMNEVRAASRAVVFVSHNMGVVNEICSVGLLLEKGRIAFHGKIRSAVDIYSGSSYHEGGSLVGNAFSGPLATSITFDKLSVKQEQGASSNSIDPLRGADIILEGVSVRNYNELDIAITFFYQGVRIFTLHDGPRGNLLRRGRFRSIFHLPPRILRPGSYTVGVGARRRIGNDYLWCDNAAIIRVTDNWDDGCREEDYGVVNVATWAQREDGLDDAMEPGAERSGQRPSVAPLEHAFPS